MDHSSKMSGEPSHGIEVEVGGQRSGSSPDQMRREIEEEFNVQRAKMKELFLQKEDNMRKMLVENEQLQSEVVSLRAELQQLTTLTENQSTEIQNLQMLVRETLEESTSSSAEARRLRARNHELEQQLQQLRQQQQQQEASLAPGTLVRSLARRLAADPDADQQQASRKNAEEEELMRCVVQQRETEIAALKTKLRDTDAQLQQALKTISASASDSASRGVGDGKSDTAAEGGGGAAGGAAGGGGAGGGGGRACSMCANYEEQLVREQRRAEEAGARGRVLDTALALATTELEGVRSLHDETVREWRAERAARDQQLQRLRGAVGEARAALEARAGAAAADTQRALHHVTRLTVDRETLQGKLDSLERDNAALMGLYTKHSAELQSDVIDLPDGLEELQEYALRVREQLICCQVGRERALHDEQELRAQLLELAADAHRQQQLLADVHRQLQQAREQLDLLQTEREQMKELADKLRSSGDMIESLLEDKKRLQAEGAELRARVSVLQQELDNSEKVQQDFVRLSQSLQVQLERIREAETEVRWQHDEDVSECPACRAPLLHHKKKVHCRHCGRIFCSSCVSHAVASGPRRAPARVCAVCRTLLQPHTAPYFSTEPPHTPD